MSIHSTNICWAFGVGPPPLELRMERTRAWFPRAWRRGKPWRRPTPRRCSLNGAPRSCGKPLSDPEFEVRQRMGATDAFGLALDIWKVERLRTNTQVWKGEIYISIRPALLRLNIWLMLNMAASLGLRISSVHHNSPPHVISGVRLQECPCVTW